MLVRVLGSVGICAGDHVCAVGPAQRRTVFAALAVDAGRPVPVDTLIERVWGERQPHRARRTLHTHLTRIRRLIEQVDPATERSLRLVRGAGGYAIEVEPDRVDVHRFTDLARRARGSVGAERARLLREALTWWGEPLVGVRGGWAERTRVALRQRHREVVLSWAEVELRLGDPGVVIGPLTELADRNPLCEAVAAALMRALSAARHNADALYLYHRLRERLADELGVDPGTELRELYAALLRDDTARPPAGPPVPAQLPAQVRGFAGRQAELARLDAILAETRRRPAATAIVVVSGPAGVGKTSLAVRWAHSVADRFPDGQLYVDLHGFAAAAPLPPAEVTRAFLDALGEPAESIPADGEERAAHYRSRIAGKRVLVVLDNAYDAGQIRQLLPGTASAMVLATSRNQLRGLVAASGAHVVTLPVPGQDEARALFAHRLGAERMREHQALGEIIASCARLPLAMAIVAARASANPGFSLRCLAEELRDARGSLDAFCGAAGVDLRQVFSWSCRGISAEAARLFRLLAQGADAEFDLPAAASLAGVPLARTRVLLAELTSVHLVSEPVPGRHTLPELLRAYAAEQAVRPGTGTIASRRVRSYSPTP